jgi:PAS domain S-box-containing protein
MSIITGGGVLASSLFPLFDAIEPRYPLQVNYFGQALEHLQILAFALTVYTNHGEILESLAPIAYAVQFPIFDEKRFFVLGTVGAAGIMWALAAISFLFVLTPCITMVFGITVVRKKSVVFIVPRAVVHFLTSVAFIPVLHLFMSFLACDAHGKLWSYRAENTCFDNTHTTQFIGALIGAVCLVMLTLTVQTCVADCDTGSAHPLARLNPRAHALTTLWKIMTVTLFHVLNARDHARWFAVYVACTAALMAAMYIFMLPYYSQRTNSRVVACFVVTTGVAIMSAISDVPESSTITRMDIDGALVLSMIGPVAAMGYALASLRVNTDYIRALPALTDGGERPLPRPSFPEYLPGHDLSHGAFRGVMAEVMDQPSVDDTSEIVTLLTPFIARVWMDSDIEAATRFLDHFAAITKVAPGVKMLVLAARIYTKGKTRFQHSSLVCAAFSNMLFTHAGKPRSALAELEWMHSKTQPSLPLRYASHRLGQGIKAELNMRDAGYQRICTSAKKTYRDALEHVVVFWTRLSAEQQDFAMLYTVASQISAKRDAAQQEFQRAFAINPHDRANAARYAVFVDHILMEGDRADAIQAALATEADERRWSAMRGARKGGKSSAISFDITPFLEESHQSRTTSARGTTLLYGRLTHGASLLLFLTAIGVIIFAIVQGLEHRRLLQGIATYSNARSYAAHGPVLASLMNLPNASNVAAALVAVGNDLRTTQNALSFGKYAPTTDEQRLFFQMPSTISFHPQFNIRALQNTVQTDSITLGGVVRLPTVLSFLEMSYNLVERLVTLGAGGVGDTNVILPLLQEADFNVASAYDRGTQLAADEIADTVTVGTAVYLALCALGLLLLAAVVTVLFANATRVSAFRVSILSLFVLVPRKIVSALLEIAKARLAHVDADDPNAERRDKYEDLVAEDEDDGLLTKTETATSKHAARNATAKRQAAEDAAAELTSVRDGFAITARAMVVHASYYSIALLLALVAVAACAAYEHTAVTTGGHDERSDVIQQHVEVSQSWLNFLRLERLVQRAVALQDDRSAADLDEIGQLTDNLKQLVKRQLAAESLFSVRPSPRDSAVPSAAAEVSSAAGRTADEVLADDRANGARLILDGAVALRDALSAFERATEAPASQRLLFGANSTGTRGVFNSVGEEARRQVFGRDSEQRRDAIRGALVRQAHRVRFTADAAENSVGRWAVMLVALVAACGCCVAVAVALVFTHNAVRAELAAGGRTPTSFWVVAGVLIAIAAVAPCALGSGFELERQSTRNVEGVHRTIDDRNATVGTLLEAARQAVRFPHTFDLRTYRRYFDSLLFLGDDMQAINDDLLRVVSDVAQTNADGVSIESPVAKRLFRSLSTLAVSDGAITISTPDGFAVTNSNVTVLIATLRNMERVALALTAAATGLPRSQSREVSDFSWDVVTENQLTSDLTLRPRVRLQYTNSTYDRARSSTDQIDVARYTLASERYTAILTNLTTVTGWYYSAGPIAKALRDLAKHEDGAVASFRVGLVSSIATALSCIALVIAAVRSKLFTRAVFVGVRSTNSNAEAAAVPSGIGRRAVPVLISAAMVVAVLMALAGVGIRSEQVATRAASHVTAVGVLQQRAAVAVVDARLAVLGKLSRAVAAASLRRHAAEVRDAWNDLLFGEADGLKIAALTEDIDTLLFRGQDYVPPPYSCAYRPVGVTLDAGEDSLAAIVARFSTATANLPTTGTADELSAAVTSMSNDYFRLYSVARQVNDAVLSHEETQRTQWTAAVAGLGGGVALVLALLYALVLWPLYRSLQTEYDDATLMLRMMPQNVRENVPAVAEFIHHALSNTTSAGHITDISYNAPIIVIDEKGTVLKFNTAAEECFGYDASEVTGNNVKMLMNDHDRRQHDDYLAKFKETGVRKIVGSERIVTAQRKSGELFPLQLNVKPLIRSNGETVYIGFLEDVTRRAELTRMEELNEVIQDLGSVPVIAIDALGTVTRFNRAAERTFGHSATDVLGQNIKMLMPESVAKHHDAYLANYLRTGVKNVIDATRRLTGITKNGDEFPFELSVKEIVGDAGTQSTYLGFVKDLSATLQLEQKTRVNDLVAALSPLPIVGMDGFGKMLQYNKAAEKMFGYSREEVIGKNVKMLMPESVAIHHDGYLEAYRLTGKKNVIGGERDVTARRKDGSEVPVRIHVGEAKQEGMRPMFLGYIVNIRQELQDVKSSALDNAVRALATFPIITMNATGTILSTNNAVCAEFGYSEEELRGENVKILMTPEVAVQHDEYLRRYQITRQRRIIGSQRRMPARRKNGTRVMIEIRVDETQDADGNSIFVGFLRNITDDLELQRTYEINRTIQDISTVPMIVIDAVGRVLRFNRAAETTWQRTSEEVANRNIKILMPEFYAKQHDQYLINYQLTGVKHIIDHTRTVEAERKDGSIFPVQVSVCEVHHPSRDRSKSLFVGYVMDVTRDGEATQMEKRNAIITALSPVPLIQIDRFGIVQKFNPAAEREFQYDAAEIVGRNVKLLMLDATARNHDMFLGNYRRTRQKKLIGTTRRDRARRKDGTEFPIEITVREIMYDNNDEHSFFAAYVRNITDIIDLELINTVSGVISDLSPIPLIAITARGTVLKFNAAGATRFGYTPDEVIGRNVKMLMPDNVAREHDGYLSAYSKTGEKHVIDTTRIVKAKTRSGEEFTAELGVRELKGDDGERMYWGYLRDCTLDIKRDSGVKLAQAVLELSSVPLLHIDHVGTILSANRATTATFGYSTEELLGANVKKLMPFTTAMRHDEYLANYLRTGQKHVIDSVREVEGQHKDGHTFHVEISVREIDRGAGKQPSFVAYLIDLTERIARSKTSLLTNATKSLCPVPLVVIDEDGIVCEFNGAAEDMWRYKAADVIGQNIKMLMPEEVAIHHDEYLANYKRTGKKSVIGTSRLVHARRNGGERAPVKINVRELLLSGGRRRYVGFVEDQYTAYASLKAAVVGESIVDMLPSA